MVRKVHRYGEKGCCSGTRFPSIVYAQLIHTYSSQGYLIVLLFLPATFTHLGVNVAGKSDIEILKAMSASSRSFTQIAVMGTNIFALLAINASSLIFTRVG